MDIMESYCEKPILSTGVAKHISEDADQSTDAPQIAHVMMVFDK